MLARAFVVYVYTLSAKESAVEWLLLTEHLRCRSKVNAEGIAFRGEVVDMDRGSDNEVVLGAR